MQKAAVFRASNVCDPMNYAYAFDTYDIGSLNTSELYSALLTASSSGSLGQHTDCYHILR